MTTLTLRWTTTVEEYHETIVELEALPVWLRDAVNDGIDLASPWRITDIAGELIGVVEEERAIEIADNLGYFLSDEEGSPTSETITDRSLTHWEVSA